MEEPVKVEETVRHVRENLRVEEQRLRNLMDDYARTLGMIE